jgi:ascorbate-specific PTS system EIIC-type component UlaA
MIEKTVNLKTKVVVFILITIVNILLARFAALSTPNIPGADTLYFAVAFMIPFALWFGRGEQLQPILVVL